MGWRMGGGQDFLEQVFCPFWRALSFADKTKYFEKYDLGPERKDRDTWYSELTCGEFAFDEYAAEVSDEEVLERIIETTMENSKSITSYKKRGFSGGRLMMRRYISRARDIRVYCMWILY